MGGVMATFEASLQRCNARPDFFDKFYKRFLASSPEVRAKFAGTDFDRQKRALRASFYMMAVGDQSRDRDTYLKEVAVRHARKNLDIGAALYDLWLDSLLATVAECDPQYDAKVADAWERIMLKGIEYMLDHYHRA